MKQASTYRPWGGFNDLHEEINRLFENRLPGLFGRDDSAGATAHWVPAVDIREESDRYLLTADIPGVEPKDIEITMENGVLTIRGERNYEKTSQEGELKRVERAYGSFYRRFALPDTVDANSIKASGRHGVLEVEIPKAPKAQARRIEVS